MLSADESKDRGIPPPTAPWPPSLSCCILDERPNLSRPQLLHPLREACDNLHQVHSEHSTMVVIIIIISHCVQEFLVGVGRAEKGEREQTGNHFSKALWFQVRQEHFPPSPPNTRGCTQTHTHTPTHIPTHPQTQTPTQIHTQGCTYAYTHRR